MSWKLYRLLFGKKEEKEPQIYIVTVTKRDGRTFIACFKVKSPEDALDKAKEKYGHIKGATFSCES